MRRSDLMVLANIFSACLIVVGVVSNVLVLGVLSSNVLERTSFRIYLQWVCSYHLISPLLTILRQHTFLLDLGPRTQAGAKSRFEGCTGLLAQRHLDRASSGVSAMRNPILLNVSAVLVAMVPTSSYIESFKLDASQYNMTMCSFSFIHTYGSPSVQSPRLIYRVAIIEEMILFASFLILLAEIINRVIRNKSGGYLTVRHLL
ncbi:hypothetical protein ElyMa_000095200 [Elysia marginata]|uniref:G-protein coupled receptors family 1 profile domain-containing protein n=1 Tax=Elysia marginata TaxID=1093978 RepID=A0AAV4EKS4_9GAST|nr:hypothetical protein ElyMa_000095200 [Elysia marginata]